MNTHEGKRWSGADWADQTRQILLIGVGGIGSFTAFSLSRIGHHLILVDGDSVDNTNITGGQFYKTSDVNKKKVDAVLDNIRQFGCSDNTIDCIPIMYKEDTGMTNICICGLDNMAARKLVFEQWLEYIKLQENKKECLFIDGRLTLELCEIFSIRGNDEAAIEEYQKEHLFSDEEADELDCTTKQSTFGAMMIASLITSTVCNFLTNNKLQVELRNVPFYQRFYLPILKYEEKSFNLQLNEI